MLFNGYYHLGTVNSWILQIPPIRDTCWSTLKVSPCFCMSAAYTGISKGKLLVGRFMQNGTLFVHNKGLTFVSFYAVVFHHWTLCYCLRLLS